MNTYAKLGIAAVVAVVLVGGAIALLRPGASSNVGGAPSAAPSAAPSVAPSVAPSPSPALSPAASPPSTADWTAFTSDRYGYTLSYPAISTGMPGSPGPAPTEVQPASRDWSLENDGEMFTTIETAERTFQATDLFVMGPNDNQIAVTVFAAPIPAGTSEDEWIASYYEASAVPPQCSALTSARPITVDGVAGRLDTCSDAQAFVFRDGRVYVFSVWQPDHEALLEAFLSTVKFTG